MSWLMRVIGRVLGTTQTATLACPTQDGQIGGNNNTVEQPQPASKELKPKHSNVKVAILAQSPKTETLCVPIRTKKSSTTGTQPATPVPPSAKPKRKPSKKVAPLTTVAVSSKQGKKSVPKELGQRGKRKTTA